jgi:arylsulfatase A-like enzyme
MSIFNLKLTCHFLFLFFFILINGYIQAQKSPNVIYIYADDLGYGDLGCYGQKIINTPHLDQMARDGMRFTQHYSGAPVCAPARAMLLTGKHAGHADIRGNYELGGFADSAERGQIPLPEGTFTIAKLMKQAGYNTAIIGKWGLGMPNNAGNPQLHGFDYAYGYLDQKQAHNYYPSHLWENGQKDTLNNQALLPHQKLNPVLANDKDFYKFTGEEYAPAKMTEKALNFIQSNQKNPFFLYLPYSLPHLALQAPDEYVNKYKGLYNETPYYGEKGYLPCKYPLSTYAAMVTFLDDQVGLVMQKLKELGIEDNTIVMFSSDNGATFEIGGFQPAFFNSNGGLRGAKTQLFEGGIREPFIVKWPGKVEAGKTSNLLSAQFDIMATLAELTNQPISLNSTDGVSLLPEILGTPASQKLHPYLYFEFPENDGQIAIRMANWKGIKVNLKKNPASKWMLFDLNSDPTETRDVAELHPIIVRKLNEILLREHSTAPLIDWELPISQN